MEASLYGGSLLSIRCHSELFAFTSPFCRIATVSLQCITPVCLTGTDERDGETVSFICVSALCSSAARAARTTCGLDAPMTRTARPARFRCPYGAPPADRHAANWMPLWIPEGFKSAQAGRLPIPSMPVRYAAWARVTPSTSAPGLGPLFSLGRKIPRGSSHRAPVP